MKHSLEGLSGRFEMAGKGISRLEYKVIHISSVKNKKGK